MYPGHAGERFGCRMGHPAGTSSHLRLGRPKAVRIHTRNLMHPLMVHPETQPRSPWRTCPTKEEWVPPQTQRRRSTLVTHPSARARERRDTDGKGVTQVPLVELRPRGSRLPAAAGIVGGTRRGAFYKDCLETVFVLGLLLRSTLSLRKPGVQSVNEFNHLVSSAFLLHEVMFVRSETCSFSPHIPLPPVIVYDRTAKAHRRRIFSIQRGSFCRRRPSCEEEDEEVGEPRNASGWTHK